MNRTAPLIAAALAILLALAVPAGSAPRDKLLWATVNICDTEAHPDTLGLRASMPGNGTRQRMYIRVRAQFFSRLRNTFVDLGGDGESRWIYVGSARFKARQGGFSFRFQPPEPGQASFIVRGQVDFEYRERRRTRSGRLREKVVRRVRANTKGGFSSTAGADPPGFSSGLCEIRQ